MEYGLDPTIGKANMQATEEVAEGKLNHHFSLVMWQTGSGTQSNMNANEISAAVQLGLLPIERLKFLATSEVMHISAAMEVNSRLVPNLKHLHSSLHAKSVAFKDIVKIGRTHTQDATSFDPWSRIQWLCYPGEVWN